MSNLTPWTKRLIIIGAVVIAIAAMFCIGLSAGMDNIIVLLLGAFLGTFYVGYEICWRRMNDG